MRESVSADPVPGRPSGPAGSAPGILPAFVRRGLLGGLVCLCVLLLSAGPARSAATDACGKAPTEEEMARMSQEELVYAYCETFHRGDRATMEALKLSMAGDNARAGLEIEKRRDCTAAANRILEYLEKAHGLTRYQFTCTKWFPSLP